ncbi:hypothetical protein E2C01_010819 [Portunus trituberculatus]|uniref:Uncharacterized protein n=1 Tax=Portunus trituberculatus TaxID=210409 RepID=A0A5B7D9F6_PORTR|nr:hypothetical protein [Portunus trituberculatus]
MQAAVRAARAGRRGGRDQERGNIRPGPSGGDVTTWTGPSEATRPPRLIDISNICLFPVDTVSMATPLEAWRSWTRIGQLVMQAVEDWSVATLTAAHLPMGGASAEGGKGINTRPGHPQPRFKHLLTVTPE